MSSTERIRVLIVDGYSVLRVGLKDVLEQTGEFEVVGQARTAMRRCALRPRRCRTW